MLTSIACRANGNINAVWSLPPSDGSWHSFLQPVGNTLLGRELGRKLIYLDVLFSIWMPSLLVREGLEVDREWAMDVLVREWHGPLIERADEFVDAGLLPFLVAESEGSRVGLATLLLGPDYVEIITLNSFSEGNGIGTALIESAADIARSRGAVDLRLFTTNDNIHAIGFYQRRGFHLHALHRDTMTRARVLKPEIPYVGRSGIVMRDELELRIRI